MNDNNLDLAMTVLKASEEFRDNYLTKTYPGHIFKISLSSISDKFTRTLTIECVGAVGSIEEGLEYKAGVVIYPKNLSVDGPLSFPIWNKGLQFKQAINAYLCGRNGKGEICEDYIPPSERTAFEEPVSTDNIDAVLATDRTILPREIVDNDFAHYQGA